MSKIKQAIIVLELKGFTTQATELSKNVEDIGITPPRIRSAAKMHIENAISNAHAKSKNKPTQHLQIGGDTWYFNFSTVTDALVFAAYLTGVIYDMAVGAGLFYLKPSIAIGFGFPQLRGDRFYDNESINTYRIADKGEPFRIKVLPEAENELSSKYKKHLKKNDDNSDIYFVLDWRSIYSYQGDMQEYTALNMSALLTDSEVAHFSTNREVIQQLMIQQQSSNIVRIFGGAINLDDDDYMEYAKAAVALVRSHSIESVVLNYYSQKATPSNYAWLKACERLSIEHQKTFSYSAYILPDYVIRPIAYHLYDDTVILFLRRYNEIRDMVSMAGSILIRNERLSQQLREHFVEGYKTTSRFNKSHFFEFEKKLSFSSESIELGDKLLKKLFQE
ncbi:hypothetical protein HGB13_04830 [bacterium]|nr:hypothetical protein [bacterium]